MSGDNRGGGTDVSAAIRLMARHVDPSRIIVVTSGADGVQFTDGAGSALPRGVAGKPITAAELATMTPIDVSGSVSAMREGFWRSAAEPHLPMPTVDAEWHDRNTFISRLVALQRRARSTAYKGSAPCRLCDRRRNGSETFSLLGWEWPSGYLHYLTDHGVRPSAAFEAFVSAHSGDHA
jgi:hypothetical protein